MLHSDQPPDKEVSVGCSVLHYSRPFSGMQATARTYEETLEEAVETVEEKLLSDQRRSEQEEDRMAEMLRREQLQAWDTKLDRDSKSKTDEG